MRIPFPFVSIMKPGKEAVPSPPSQDLIEKPPSHPASASGRSLHRLASTNKDDKKNASPNYKPSWDLRRVFDYFDADRDGKISLSELRSCMATFGDDLSQADLQDVLFESTGTGGDGSLGFEDFLRLMEVEGEEERKRDLREAFGMYEMEGSGSITPKSLKRMLSRLGESKTIEECKFMISRFDLNGDGVLSFEEFKAMML